MILLAYTVIIMLGYNGAKRFADWFDRPRIKSGKSKLFPFPLKLLAYGFCITSTILGDYMMGNAYGLIKKASISITTMTACMLLNAMNGQYNDLSRYVLAFFICNIFILFSVFDVVLKNLHLIGIIISIVIAASYKELIIRCLEISNRK